MEFPVYQASPWHYLLSSSAVFYHSLTPENHVNWTETPESHIYSADLPGVRKEEIKVAFEDSRYVIIRTEAIDESTQPTKNFKRKFRLPDRVDVNEDGVLTVTVPRSFARRRFFIDPADLPERLEVLARAA